MPEKPKTDWKNIKTIIAAASITMLVTIWNTFATHDRREDRIDATASTPTVAPQASADDSCPTPIPGRAGGANCVVVTSTRSS